MKTDTNKMKPDVTAYLNRIGYDGPVKVDICSLSQLQECHVRTVPYENFDILDRKPLSLEIPDLFDKIITRYRGGYCFELNAMFGWLLRELGFTVTDYFARFWRDEPITPPMRRHHVLQVELEGVRYLCDVGVGGVVPRRPVKMIENLTQEQGGEYYRLEQDAYFGWVLCEKKGEEWNWIYSFTEEPQLPQDYLTTSFWCENAPDSIFTKDVLVAIRTAEGRNTISGNEFRIFTTEGVQVFTPQTVEEYTQALHTHFGLSVGYVPPYL